MKKVTFLTGVVALAAFTASVAFAADEASPRHKLSAACKPDVEKFCADVERHKGKIRACLEEHAADLQEACGTVLKGLPPKAVQ